MATATATPPKAAPTTAPAAAPKPAPAATTEAAKPRKGVMKTIPKGMHLEYCDSLGIENLIPVVVYDDNAAIDADSKPGTGAKLANAYMRQKGVLVWGRDQITDYLASSEVGFKPLTKTEAYKVDGVEKTRVVWTETEAEYFGRFKKAVLASEFKHPRFPATSEQAFDAAMCTLAKELGPWACSAKEAERTASERTPPQYAMKNAESIFSDTDKEGKTKSVPLAGRLKKWAETFKAENITFEAFDQAAPASATDEEKTAVRAANVTKLAWAIKAREDAKAVKEYV